MGISFEHFASHCWAPTGTESVFVSIWIGCQGIVKETFQASPFSYRRVDQLITRAHYYFCEHVVSFSVSYQVNIIGLLPWERYSICWRSSSLDFSVLTYDWMEYNFVVSRSQAFPWWIVTDFHTFRSYKSLSCFFLGPQNHHNIINACKFCKRYFLCFLFVPWLRIKSIEKYINHLNIFTESKCFPWCALLLRSFNRHNMRLFIHVQAAQKKEVEVGQNRRVKHTIWRRCPGTWDNSTYCQAGSVSEAG